MAAADKSHNHHKKSLVKDRSGLSWETKQHLEHVKQKMFAFINQQRRVEADQNRLPPPPPLIPPPPMFGERENALRPPQHHHHHHHRSPGMPHKQLQTPFLGQRKAPHVAFATPQVPRRPRI